MSCIDSAIIKTLVEHMNGGNTSASEIFDLKKTENVSVIDNELHYSIPPQFGNLLKLKRKNSNVIDTFICTTSINVLMDINDAEKYIFYNGSTNIMFTKVEASNYTAPMPSEYEIPDNETTGLFQLDVSKSLDLTSIGSVLAVLIDGLSNQFYTIEANFKTLKRRTE